MRRLFILGILTAFALGILVPRATEAQVPFYQGKTITIVVGYKPGGGYDTIARILSRHLPKYIPGKPTVIVQNMPGAGSMIAANHLYGLAAPDGLTIGSFNPNMSIAQLIKVEGVKFDLTKFAWIGSAAQESTILVIRSDLPYTNFEALRRTTQPIVVGTSGPGSSSYDFPLLLKEFLGMNFKIVAGYSSSADIALALERKEVDAWAVSFGGSRSLIDRGVVRAIIRSRTSEPGIEHLPVDEALAPNQKAKAIMTVRSAPEVVGRVYAAPPGTPTDRLKVLQEAFAKALMDSELQAEAQKAKLVLKFTPGDEVLKVLKEVLNQPKEIVEDFTKYIKFGD